MLDVPIIIFFCTQIKPLTIMEKIISERDNLLSSETQEKKDMVENIMNAAKCYFAPYRNIHVLSANKNIDVEKLMTSPSNS